MSTSVQFFVFFVIFIISFVYLRLFIDGIKRYQLNNSAYKKKKQNETVKEWLLYSRYKNEIPKSIRTFYFIVLLIHFVGLIICLLLCVNKLTNISELFIRIIIGIDVCWVIIIRLLFWTPSGEDYYERWIKKNRGQKNRKKR